MLTYDSDAFQTDAAGNHRGVSFGAGYRVSDGEGSFRTVDSSGAFLVGELERLDMKLHEPLASVTWGRDIDLREDVSIADEVSSFTLSQYASASGLGMGQGIGTGKAWAGKDTTQITGVSVDIGKIPHPLRPWTVELKYTILELESAARVGRPVDQQKFNVMQLKHQMDIDEQVYYGDTTFGDKGIITADTAAAGTGQVTNKTTVAATGATSGTVWTSKTPDNILADVNELLTSVWQASGLAFPPNRILIPPTQFGYITTQKVSDAGNVSILRYLLENNLTISTNNVADRLQIFPCKWCVGAGTGGTIGTAGIDRMVAYTKDPDRIRYPMTLLQRTPVQYDGIYHKSTYFCRLGVVEVVYPETIGMRDAL